MKELYKLCENNIWIDHLQKCSKDNTLKGENWIDFEFEISKIIKALEYDKVCLKDKVRTGNTSYQAENKSLFDIGYNFIDGVRKYSKKENLKHLNFNNFHDDTYRKKVIKELNCELEELIRCLEIYLEEVVEKIDIENKLLDIEEIESIDKLISFNYTDTFKRVYDKDNNVECDYIHGSLDISESNKENNMVLGIDEYLENGDESAELDFIQFKKYFQRIYKKTGCVYKGWLEERRQWRIDMSEIVSNDYIVEDIYFYGHSLDVTDKDIIKELLMFPNTQSTVFYYDNDDYIQKIRNIVALITPDELIDRVYGAKPRIVFKKIRTSSNHE
ncbi:AbiH family protein [Clostridium saccharobutylicum]|uniref:Uncharacterized protein n=1 Tax=Clostridium saccharobutylicum TaxID=169679 RepID=A0A1S8MYP1_CLOSA|nr:AbiH family protein [Clostridium saccharobutylicum]OOM09318.1 hypothetical protein CLOSAC_35990 [Clostridium saccharobutylicum]